jgi:ATP-dependent helicase IRC3
MSTLNFVIIHIMILSAPRTAKPTTTQLCRLSRLYSSLTTQTQPHKVSSLILRPYQQICLKACLDAHATGASRIGVSLPTGAGKTAVFISLLSSLEPRNGRPDATKSLVIVNSIELAKQAAAQARRLRPDWVVEMEQGSKHKASGEADL